MTPEYPIDEKQFKTWLESKEPWEIVGEAHKPCGCPIANFLRDRGEEVHVGGNAVYNLTCEVELGLLPEWAQDFISNIDSKFFSPSVVRAAKALEYL